MFAPKLKTEDIKLPRSIVIFDHDAIFVRIIEKHLNNIGIDKVAFFLDSKEGWDKISQEPQNVDFIAMDWELRGYSGIALLNRLRQDEHFKDIPVVITSGTLEKEDFQLIGELPLTRFILKPFSNQNFQSILMEMNQEKIWRDKNAGAVAEIFKTIGEDDTKMVIGKAKSYLSAAPNPIPVALMICSQLRKDERYVEAEEILKEILYVDPKSVHAMNELGKIYILQGRHNDAHVTLKKAASISPKNIERICLQGEVGLNLGNPGVARSLFQKALAMDPEHEKAKAGVHVSSMVEDHMRKNSIKSDDVAGNFASLLNTAAIAKIHNEMFKEGIEGYRSALTFLTTKLTSSKLAFNLGLAYLKANSPRDAYPWFVQCLRLNPDMVKSKKYIARIRKHLNIEAPIEGVQNWEEIESHATEDEEDLDW